MYEQSINKACKLLSLFNDKAHDRGHAQRVAENAVAISNLVNYADVELMRLCGYWHDVGRTVQNDGHERISAQMIKNDLLEQGINNSICVIAYNAIVYHKWNMKPHTIEGNIIRDADKLDFISIERWTACLESHQLRHLKEIKALLPRLRSMFYFESSRKLYDQRIKLFLRSKIQERVWPQ